MLQRMIHSARENVFESALFYYWALVVLTSYFLMSRFLQKLSFVYLGNRWIELKIGEVVLFGLLYLFVIISSWSLRKKIPKYIFFCWVSLILIFFVREFYTWLDSDQYSLVKSFTKNQGYYTLKFTMPLLFGGVWPVLKKSKFYGEWFLRNLLLFLIVNILFIVVGFIFKVPLFESYPLSGRFGYSGLLYHISLYSDLYGIFLVFSLFNKTYSKLKGIVLNIPLLLIGQKAGLLYFLLIHFLAISSRALKALVFSIGCILIFLAPSLIPTIVKFSPFYSNVYNNHGVWGVIFSLRNENFLSVFSGFDLLSVSEILFGGWKVYPVRVEMMIFDLFIYFGAVGLIILIFFFWKYVKTLKLAIPIIIACFSGGVHEVTFGMLIYVIVVNQVLKINYKN